MEEQKKVSINISQDVAAGIYSNLALISHSNSEFVVDFAQALPGTPGPTVRSRILLTPDNAKKLLNALMENVARYEAQNGTINDGGMDTKFNFN